MDFLHIDGTGVEAVGFTRESFRGQRGAELTLTSRRMSLLQVLVICNANTSTWILVLIGLLFEKQEVPSCLLGEPKQFFRAVGIIADHDGSFG